MVQVRIEQISGGTPPITVTISDIYGNNQTVLGVIGTGTTVPPTIYYNSTIPKIFETAPEIMLTLTDSNGCQTIKILECTFGCAFAITVKVVSCILDITLTVEE